MKLQPNTLQAALTNEFWKDLKVTLLKMISDGEQPPRPFVYVNESWTPRWLSWAAWSHGYNDWLYHQAVWKLLMKHEISGHLLYPDRGGGWEGIKFSKGRPYKADVVYRVKSGKPLDCRKV